MLYFDCDYNNGCHEKVMEALVKTNAFPSGRYGEDEYSDSAKEKIRKKFRCPDADIYFLGGGTQTNSVVISTVLCDYQGVVAAKTGHVATHESGAIEYTGHKVLEIGEHDGKIDAVELEHFVSDYYADDNHEHMVSPGMVYISFPTEFGTIYTKKELEDIHSICVKYDMPLFIDGARLAYGLESSECDITYEEFAQLCDIFYIGGTKCGTLCGEALVFPRNNAPKHFLSLYKQRGALFAKGRLNGVQFDALFTDDLYCEIGKSAIKKAEELKSILREKSYRFYLETPTNQQFVIVSNDKLEKLKEKISYSYMMKFDEQNTVIRFCTSWSTTDKEMMELRDAL